MKTVKCSHMPSVEDGNRPEYITLTGPDDYVLVEEGVIYFIGPNPPKDIKLGPGGVTRSYDYPGLYWGHIKK